MCILWRKKVFNILNYYEIFVVNIECPFFCFLFSCNAFFHCWKRFTVMNGHNKQISVYGATFWLLPIRFETSEPRLSIDY